MSMASTASREWVDRHPPLHVDHMRKMLASSDDSRAPRRSKQGRAGASASGVSKRKTKAGKVKVSR